MSVTYVLFTGGFDPVHSGHIAAMKEATKLGTLIVAPNSDSWLIRKKGAAFQPLEERSLILRSIKYISDLLLNWDDSDGTACDAIKTFYNNYGCSGTNTLLFVNGGDRTPTSVSQSEIDKCAELGIMPVFNVGGLKTQSSSTFLQEWSRRV